MSDSKSIGKAGAGAGPIVGAVKKEGEKVNESAVKVEEGEKGVTTEKVASEEGEKGLTVEKVENGKDNRYFFQKWWSGPPKSNGKQNRNVGKQNGNGKPNGNAGKGSESDNVPDDNDIGGWD